MDWFVKNQYRIVPKWNVGWNVVFWLDGLETGDRRRKTGKFKICPCLKYVDHKFTNMGINSIFTEGLRSQQNRYFSEDIKKKIVRDLEMNLIRISDVCQTYQVSRTSVYRWIYKYSAMAKKKHKQVVESKSDTARIKALEERIKELERTVGQKQIMIDFKDKMIELAEQRYNVDIKKKLSSKALSGSDTTKKNTDIR